MEIVSKIALVFTGCGASAGLVSGLLPSSEAGLLIFIIFYYVSYKMTPRVLKIPEKEIPGGRRKVLTTGFWPYFTMWLVFWIVVYTLMIAK